VTAFTCCCTNQCPTCGQCCQTGREHRGGTRWVGTGTTPLPPVTWPVHPPTPLDADDIRRIVREEIARAIPSKHPNTPTED
jgi:hypothetical protein